MLLGFALIGTIITGFWSRTQMQGSLCLTSIQQEALVHLDGIQPRGNDRETIRAAALVQTGLERSELRLARMIDIGGLPATRGKAEVASVVDDIAAMRDVTAWQATSPALTRTLLVLADAHQQRLEQLLQQGGSPLDQTRNECTAESVDRLWQRVLRWSGSPHN